MDEAIAVDRSQWKAGLVVAITVITGVWLGYAIDQWSEVADVGATIAIVLALTVFTALFILQALMVHSWRVLGMFAIVEGFAMVSLGFQSVGFTNATLLGGLITIIALVIAGRYGQGYTERTIAISIREAGNAVVPILMTAVTLCVTVAFTSGLSTNGLQFSRETILGIMKPGEWVVQRFIPGFRVEGTLKEFVRANSGSIFQGGIGAVPRALQDAAISGAITQLQETIEGMFAVRVGVNDSLVDIIERVVNSELRKIPESWHTSVWIGIGAIIFFTVKGFGALIGGVAKLIAALLYQLLLAVGFMQIGSESRQKEIVVL